MDLFNQEKITALWKKWLSKGRLRIYAWTGLFLLVILMLLALQFGPKGLNWTVGQVASRDVQSGRYLNFVDESATVAKQEKALEGFQDIYKIDLEKFNNITILSISDYFAEVEQVSEGVRNGQVTLDQGVAQLRDVFEFSLSAEEWTSLLTMSDNQTRQLYEQGIDYAVSVMSQGVSQENITGGKEKISDSIRNDQRINDASEAFLLAVIDQVMFYPTYVFDQEATENKKAEILATVEAEKIIVQKGELVVRKGEILTERQLSILQMLGYASENSTWIILGALAFFVVVMVVVVAAFLRQFIPSVYQSEKHLVLLMLLVAVTLAFYQMILALTLSPIAEQAEQVGYLLPVATGTMLIAILLDVRLAILVNMMFAAMVGLYTSSVSFTIVALMSGIIGAIGVSSISQRSDISKTALYISLANSVIIFSLGLLNNQGADVIFISIIFGIMNGFFSSVFTIGLLPYLESAFGITSAIKLLELSNPNQALLKQLLSEAPGTYHHCVMVGNLGEAAADAIGANGLLVRLGAYYHDIGKLKRPYFFAENQFSGENPHDNITPQLSTLIITSHVKDGIEMATEAKLPPVVLDLIAQHHGNSLVSYFYHKAKNLDDQVKESDFRYEQAKPQTKEAAILMMADTVEAAVRSKKDATPGQLEGFIRKLIKNKLDDGQFDECELTFRDLDQIATAFVRVVNGIYHKRIEYPNQETMMAKKKRGA